MSDGRAALPKSGEERKRRDRPIMYVKLETASCINKNKHNRIYGKMLPPKKVDAK